MLQNKNLELKKKDNLSSRYTLFLTSFIFSHLQIL